jgi:uncharacterized protein (TIGR03089 family)
MDLLDRWTARSGSAGLPFVTYYDVATGERTELSGTTTRNWVAKASSLLVDELDAEPGTRLRLGLPTHWQRVVWILAAWTIGAQLVDADAEIAVTGPDLDLGDATARHRLASALLPFGARFPTPPDGFLDLGAVLPGQPDAFTPYVQPTDDSVAVDLAERHQTRAEVIASITPSGERLAFTPAPLTRDVDAVLAAALGGGSIVLVNGGSADALRSLALQEHAQIA